MALERIFRVNAASGLNLRNQPSTNSVVLTGLKRGQALVRMNDVDYDGWFYVFADTPGYGIYLGYVHASFLTHVTDGVVPEAIGVPNPHAEETSAATPDPAPTQPETPDDDRELPGREEAMPTVVDSQGGALARVLENGWHPDIPSGQRHDSPSKGARRGTDTSVHRVVIHITGTGNFQSAHNTFMNRNIPASAHYMIDKDGALHQYVAEDKRAWHAGISSKLRPFYSRTDGSWRKYLFHRPGMASYPNDGVLFDFNENSLPDDASGDNLMGRPDGGEWQHYQYFVDKWGPTAAPVGFDHEGHDPNNNSIGIEIRSFGHKTPKSSVYTEAMYDTLEWLVRDICLRHSLPINKETVCGHEDVNPMARWGWDPNAGFDWDRMMALAESGAMV